MEIKKIAVIGAGAMGHGIAQLAAMSGLDTVMRDINKEFVEAGMKNIRWSIGKLIGRGKISPLDGEKALKRLSPIVSLKDAVEGADFIIEAIPEKLALKQQVFKEIDESAPSQAILATNTSALPITEIAAATKRPDKVIGMHFFNPPVLMRLVEVVMGQNTNTETRDATLSLSKKFGKEPVLCNKDVPGFIANRITISGTNLVAWMVHKGEYTIEEIDAAAMYKAGMPMGTFALLDFTGLDIAYHVMKFMEEREPFFEVSPLIKAKMESGEIGVKAGKGFYNYPEKGKFVMPQISEDKSERFDPMTQTYVMTNVAAELIRNNVATAEDIDKTLKLGFNMPIGVLELADTLGIDIMVSKLHEIAAKYGEFYKPSPLLTQMVDSNKLGTKTGEGFYSYKK
ncbi:MAG: 3-hydroxyacyl-CoA dehydrogenase [Candidatus Bathyarchaeota archaeon]|nr:MAG: 3-hydroxyacyl-CoA dehydrogenase [Candidatus Bathyarchaeota archaeon]